MERVQRSRAKGYKTPVNTKYVGRVTKFGNIFKLNKEGYIQVYTKNKEWIIWSDTGGFEQKDIVKLYENWIKGKLQKEHIYIAPPPNLDELRGKNLSCWCNLNKPCHVDVLIELLK